MGQACECGSHLDQLQNQPVHISTQQFHPIQPNENILQEIKKVSNDKILTSFQSFNYYEKDADTTFIGTISQNEASQYGILYTKNKSLYFGQFQKGKFNGNGVLKILNYSLIFQGQFKQSKPNGKGVLSDQNNAFVFQGVWKQNLNNNKSIPDSGVLLLHQNKNIQKIDFESFQHNKATITYKNKSVFEGFIQKNSFLPNGSGKMEYLSGDSYEGQWVLGKFQGVGTYKWKNGEIYNGQYFEGHKHGEGTFTYKDQSKYIGEWKQGKRQGLGRIINGKGSIMQKGIYKDDKFDIEQTKNYLDSYMEKPRQQLVSQLMEEDQDRNDDDISIERNKSNISQK